MTPAELVEYVDSIDQKHEDAHKRLGARIDSVMQQVENNYTYLRERAEANKLAIEQGKTNLDNLGRAPVNVDKIVFTPKVLAAIVVSLLSIYGFFLASTSSLRGDIHDLKTAVDAKVVTDKARADLEDVQMQSLRNNVDDLKRQVQLLQYDNQTLKDLARKAAR